MGHPAERRPRAELGRSGARGAGGPLILVLDASAALWYLTAPFDERARVRSRLVAPPLLWSQVSSVLHARAWRRELSEADARALYRDFLELGVEERAPVGLRTEAWAIADELGVAKTYDAEYLALARLTGGHVLTTDERLARGAKRTGLVVLPDDLPRVPVGRVAIEVEVEADLLTRFHDAAEDRGVTPDELFEEAARRVLSS